MSGTEADCRSWTNWFVDIGHYRNKQFAILPEWRPRKGLYVWAHSEAGSLVPLRIGIACGVQGFGGRFNLHNQWLGGTFHADDEREQAVRALTIQGLGDEALVLAVEMVEWQLAVAV